MRRSFVFAPLIIARSCDDLLFIFRSMRLFQIYFICLFVVVVWVCDAFTLKYIIINDLKSDFVSFPVFSCCRCLDVFVHCGLGFGGATRRLYYFWLFGFSFDFDLIASAFSLCFHSHLDGRWKINKWTDNIINVGRILHFSLITKPNSVSSRSASIYFSLRCFFFFLSPRNFKWIAEFVSIQLIIIVLERVQVLSVRSYE